MGGDVDALAPSALGLVPLAATANDHVFDVSEPTPEEVDAFWADVDTARQRTREHGFWERPRRPVPATFRATSTGGRGPTRATSRRQGGTHAAAKGARPARPSRRADVPRSDGRQAAAYGQIV